MSVLKILSDTNCIVRCDFQEVGNVLAGELYKLQLKKGCYILEFLVEDIVIFSMDYTIETNDEEPLLRLNIKDLAEKKIMERQFAFVYSEDGRTIIGCNKSFEGELIVPEGVEHIGELAFDSCKATSIRIHNSVKSIGRWAFDNCSDLVSVHISDIAAWCNIAFGSYASNPLYCAQHLYLGNEEITDLIIPNSVKSIGNHAFAGCSGLTSITIPNSVRSIGSCAFAGCSGLTSITIPISVKSIGNDAFAGCSGLTSVIIPNSVTSIGNDAFAGCSGLTSVMIPNSVTSIRDGAFSGCSDLASVMIPNGVTSIGNYAFGDCCSLTLVTIPNSVKSIGNYAFEGTGWYNNQGDDFLYLDYWLLGYKGDEPTGQLTIDEETKGIGDNAFCGCSGLTSVTIPSSVTSIGDDAFSDCSGLISVTIPNSVKNLGRWAFCGCSSLISVTIPNSVTSIEDGTFSGCSGLTSVTIPNSVKNIGYCAFSKCSALTSITIPSNVTSIGNGAFSNCSGLTSVTIPNSVKSIGPTSFWDCDNLKEIIIPKGTRAKFEEMLPDQKDKLVEHEEMTQNDTKDRILFFDTETTGVPLNYKASSSDTQNWPRLVQLAWILTDEVGNRIHTSNLIVKPDGFVIPIDVTKVHGISTQRAKEEGVPIAAVIERFKSDLDMATYIVGHNIEFDKKIVGAEMIRLGMKDELEKKKSYCTMQSSINFCKIPGKYGYKYPKLQELYRKLFDEDFGNAHNAMSDIEATEKCFWELRKRKLI